MLNYNKNKKGNSQLKAEEYGTQSSKESLRDNGTHTIIIPENTEIICNKQNEGSCADYTG